MVRRRLNKPKAVMARDRQFWPWAKISLPRDQKDDVISRLMDRLYAEGLLSVDMRPARIRAQVDESIARQIELMPAAFSALHARRGAEMQRRFRLIVTARKRYYLAAKKGSPRRGGTSQRGQASERGGNRGAQQQQQQQESQQQEDSQMEEEEEEEEEEFSEARSIPWSNSSSSSDDAPPREQLSPILGSSTPEEPRPMDVDLPAPALKTPHRASEGEIHLFSPNYEPPRSPVDSHVSQSLQASPASPPPEQEPAGISATNRIQNTQPEIQSTATPSRGGDEVSEVSTEPKSPPEDAMRKDLVLDEDYDEISTESSVKEVPGASQVEETPCETGQSSGDLAEEHPEEHPEEVRPEEHPEEESSQEAQSQHLHPPEDDLSDYTSDDSEAEQKRNPITPRSQGQIDQMPSSSYSQEQFTQYRQSGCRSPSSGSTTEKDIPSEGSEDNITSAHLPSAGSGFYIPNLYDSFSEDFLDDEPPVNVPSTGSALPSPSTVPRDASTATYNPSSEASHTDRPPAHVPYTSPASFDPNAFRDEPIIVENSSGETTKFMVREIASLASNHIEDNPVPIQSIRFNLFLEMLRPLNYDPERHEIYWNGSKNEEIVRSGSGVVAAMLVAQLHEMQIKFFLGEKRQ